MLASRMFLFGATPIARPARIEVGNLSHSSLAQALWEGFLTPIARPARIEAGNLSHSSLAQALWEGFLTPIARPARIEVGNLSHIHFIGEAAVEDPALDGI